jgi:hypothetical protein
MDSATKSTVEDSATASTTLPIIQLGTDIEEWASNFKAAANQLGWTGYFDDGHHQCQPSPSQAMKELAACLPQTVENLIRSESKVEEDGFDWTDGQWRGNLNDMLKAVIAQFTLAQASVLASSHLEALLKISSEDFRSLDAYLLEVRWLLEEMERIGYKVDDYLSVTAVVGGVRQQFPDLYNSWKEKEKDLQRLARFDDAWKFFFRRARRWRLNRYRDRFRLYTNRVPSSQNSTSIIPNTNADMGRPAAGAAASASPAVTATPSKAHQGGLMGSDLVGVPTLAKE